MTANKMAICNEILKKCKIGIPDKIYFTRDFGTLSGDSVVTDIYIKKIKASKKKHNDNADTLFKKLGYSFHKYEKGCSSYTLNNSKIHNFIDFGKFENGCIRINGSYFTKEELKAIFKRCEELRLIK